MKSILTSAAAQGQIARGLGVSWIAQFIQIAAGFIVPRWIDHGLGRETLGVWDLGWSFVSYLTLLEAGIGCSVNRYVALHRAEGDTAGVNRVVSSVATVQRGVSLIILGITALIAVTLPHYLRGQPASLLHDGRLVVIILGFSVALSLSGSIYTGVLSGCHRWVTHHSIYASTNLLSVIGMCAVLKLGFGIVALAVVHLACEALGRIARAIASYRAYPGLSIRWAHVDRATIREMMSFGGRVFVGRMSQVFMIQTISILIASHLGPAVLALFARPRSLVRQAAVFPQKYAIMLAPAAAALSTLREKTELRNFVMDSARSGVYVSLPVMVFLAICGEPLLQVWMGHSYADARLMLLLTCAFTADVIYQPLSNLLLGLNLHGRPGLVSAIGAGVAILLAYFALRGGYGLHAVALAIAIPWTVAQGIYLPLFACLKLEIPIWEFLKHVWTRPLLCSVPFGFSLVLGRLLFPSSAVASLGAGAILGGIVLGVCYWIWVLPVKLKQRITGRFSNRGADSTELVDPAAEAALKQVVAAE